jgi:hypothetical protein
METKLANGAETYAVERGELVVNGSHLAISPKCVRLCLERHGLDPEQDHERLPAQVGRHILRISSFVVAFALGRKSRAAASHQGGDHDRGA